MGEWRDIETAPMDGTVILCCWAGEPDSVCFLRWKHNRRLDPLRHRSPTKAEEDWLACRSVEYFGDPDEWDDYDLAVVGNGPTHWMPIPDPPEPTDA